MAEVFSDELRERRYVIVDGVDGRTHYVELGLRNADDARLIRNTIIELRAREIAPRAVDRTIAEIASRNHGLYSIGLHGAADPGASAEFIQTHVRRLEAMRRQGLAERLADGAWRVGPDHLDRAARFEEANRLQRPGPCCRGRTSRRCRTPLARHGLTGTLSLKHPRRSRQQEWGPRPAQRFGRAGNVARSGTRPRAGSRIAYARNLLQTLERPELAEVGARIASETGLGYA